MKSRQLVHSKFLIKFNKHILKNCIICLFFFFKLLLYPRELQVLQEDVQARHSDPGLKLLESYYN